MVKGMNKAKILVVDDEKNILETVRYNLEKSGYRVCQAEDGEKAVEVCRKEMPDLIILDWMLPKSDGLEVCRILRGDSKTKHIPIIMLSVRSDETDKVVGLEIGADDYLSKPFSPRELLARVKAVLRRGGVKEEQETFTLGALEADWGRHVIRVSNKALDLTSKEFGLLKSLIDAKGRVLTREILLDKVWGYDRSAEIETRTVDLHISQLRKKLGSVSKRITTVKNVGYRFEMDD